MEINRNNYEIFFMDYLDGNLSGNEIDQFLDFIKQNPDLKKELQGIEELKMPVENIGFSNKGSLYKSEKQKPVTENFTAVAYMEGDLSDLETKLFLQHLEFHPEQGKELELLLKTRMQADESIVFPEKTRLYKKTAGQRFIYWGTRVAAILVLVLSFWAVFNLGNKKEIVNPVQTLVENKEVKINQVEKSDPQKQIASEIETKNTATVELKNNTKVVPVKDEIIEPVKNLSREPENIGYLQPIFAKLEPVSQSSEPMLAIRYEKTEPEKSQTKYYTIDSYFAERVLKIKKSEKAEHKTLFETGLDLASNVSGERIQYETEQGKVSKISFDTRLLAFSIPVKK